MKSLSQRTVIITLLAILLAVAGLAGMIGLSRNFRAELSPPTSMPGNPQFMPSAQKQIPNLDSAQTVSFSIIFHSLINAGRRVIGTTTPYQVGLPGIGQEGGWIVSIGKSKKFQQGEDYVAALKKVCFGRLNDNEVCSNGQLTVGKQHHIAVVHTGTEVNFYIDGALDSTLPFRTSFNSQQNPYMIGDGIRGFLSDIRVFSAPLGTTDIAALAANQPLDTPSLIGRWFGASSDEAPVVSEPLAASDGGANICTRPALPWKPLPPVTQERIIGGGLKVSILKQPTSMQTTDNLVPFEVKMTNTNPSVTIDDAEFSLGFPSRENSVPDGQPVLQPAPSEAGLECSSDPDCNGNVCQRISLAPGASRIYKIFMKIDKHDCGTAAKFFFYASSRHYPNANGEVNVFLPALCKTTEKIPFMTADPPITEPQFQYITRVSGNYGEERNRKTPMTGTLESLDGNVIVQIGTYEVENLPTHYLPYEHLHFYGWPQIFDVSHPELGFVKLPPVPKDVLDAYSRTASDLPYTLTPIGISSTGETIALSGHVDTPDRNNVFPILLFDRTTEKYTLVALDESPRDSDYNGAEYLTSGVSAWKNPVINGLPTRRLSMTADGRLALLGRIDPNDYFHSLSYHLYDPVKKEEVPLEPNFGLTMFPNVTSIDCQGRPGMNRQSCFEEILSPVLAGTAQKPLIFFTVHSGINGSRHFKTEGGNFVINGVRIYSELVDTKQGVYSPYMYDVTTKQAAPLFEGTSYFYDRLVSINPQMYASRGATVHSASPDGRYVYLIQRRTSRDNIPMSPPDPNLLAYDRQTQKFIRLSHLNEWAQQVWGNSIGVYPFVFGRDPGRIINPEAIPPGTLTEKNTDGTPKWAALLRVVLPGVNAPVVNPTISSASSSSNPPVSSAAATSSVGAPAALNPVITPAATNSVAAPVIFPPVPFAKTTFNGLSSLVSVSNLDSAKTVAAFIRDTAPVSEKQAPKGIVMAGAPNGWGLYLGKNNLLCFGKIGVSEKCSTKPVSANVEHHVAAAFDGKQVGFFVDGILDTSVPYAETFNAGGSQYFIGGAYYKLWNSSNFFNGSIRDVRAYAGALGASDIAIIAKGGAMTGDSPLGNWLTSTADSATTAPPPAAAATTTVMGQEVVSECQFITPSPAAPQFNVCQSDCKKFQAQGKNYAWCAGWLSLSSASCGDGVVQASEQCDDGNIVDNDGCSGRCMDEFCGDGTVQPPEQCDDGNTRSNDDCSSRCTFPAARAAAPIAPLPPAAPIPAIPPASNGAPAEKTVTDCSGLSWLDFMKCMSGF